MFFMLPTAEEEALLTLLLQYIINLILIQDPYPMIEHIQLLLIILQVSDKS